ncbi:hypothetical protein LXL04_019969 [Taraxacum kok-saghyz]
MSESFMVRFQNSCSSFCISPRGQYSFRSIAFSSSQVRALAAGKGTIFESTYSVLYFAILGARATGEDRFSLFEPARELNHATNSGERLRLAAHKVFVGTSPEVSPGISISTTSSATTASSASSTLSLGDYDIPHAKILLRHQWKCSTTRSNIWAKARYRTLPCKLTKHIYQPEQNHKPLNEIQSKNKITEIIKSTLPSIISLSPSIWLVGCFSTDKLVCVVGDADRVHMQMRSRLRDNKAQKSRVINIADNEQDAI